MLFMYYGLLFKQKTAHERSMSDWRSDVCASDLRTQHRQVMGVILALFTTSNYPLMALIEDIDLGKIGLPELQRPFVWPNVNVRDLFDSLYRGYPAGFLLLLETGATTELRRISDDRSGDRKSTRLNSSQ